jgi:type VI protein secretion system component Hcp
MPIYMHFEGIKGTVHRDRKSWVEVESFQWITGGRVGVSGVGAATREPTIPTVYEAVFTKPLDATSTELHKANAWGVGSKVVVEFYGSDSKGESKTPDVSYTLEYPTITSYSLSGAGSKPMEAWALMFVNVSVDSHLESASKDARSKATPRRV